MVPQLDPFNPGNNEFGTKERVFNFGAVIAQLPDPAAAARPASAQARAGAAAGRPKSPSPGKSVEPSPAGTPRAALLPSGGAKAALKFTNPGKVPCVVSFAVRPRGTLLAGGCPQTRPRSRQEPALANSCAGTASSAEGVV